MCGYFFIGFIDFMLAGIRLTEFFLLFMLASFFFPHDFKKNDDIILSYSNDE